MKELTLKEKIFQTDDIVYLIFDGDVDFEPGHAISVIKDDIKRYYSVASAPSDGVITLLVHLVDNGKMSSIFRKAKPGEVFYTDHVTGKLSINHLNDKVAVLTGGTGLAPFRSLYREAVIYKGMDLDVIHLHSARYERDIGFLGEWKQYGINFIPTITRDPNYPGEKGRIDKEKIERLIPDYKDRTFLICGPKEFVVSMVKAVRELGVKKFVVEGW